ncbi:MAG: DUF3445 domain-containing protein [Rhodobacteraceae bacterium]|nr:DUF3445 domain-containing protein [Paracoccaceae bacterium]
MAPNFTTILHGQLAFKPWLQKHTRKLPGINPLNTEDWLIQDEVFDQQMAYKDYLIKTRRNEVFDCIEGGDDIAQELLNIITEHLGSQSNYTINPNQATRPDGVKVDLRSDHPLIVAGRLIQEDLCILKRAREQHILVGACLCFPARWVLKEKIGHPLTHIHSPVPSYNDRIAKVTQRMFDQLQPDTVIYRGNFLAYDNPDLFQPQREGEEDNFAKNENGWVRVERQTLRKLAISQGVVFGIHTAVCAKDRVEDIEEFFYYLSIKDKSL